MFNRIQLVRYDTNSNELERVIVPIQYATKEKYVNRLNEDPTLNKSTAITLPRMSFELIAINYAPDRKQTTTQRLYKKNTSGSYAEYQGVPYDLNFELNIYARNIDDGNQIIEQILPYFTPDLSFTYDMVPNMDIKRDITTVLDSVNQQVDYEGGFDSVRSVYWTLTFTMRAEFWGPVASSKIIKKVTTNIFNDPSLYRGYITTINTNSGNGTFKIDDLVYQGDTYARSDAYGYVQYWSANTGKLVIGATQGQFRTNNTIHALSTNATYNIASFDASPLKLASIVVQPNPLTANVDDDYGYTTTITEYPSTLG